MLSSPPHIDGSLRVTLGRPHTLLLDSAEFRERLDDEAQIVFEALWRRGDPQTFTALDDREDAFGAALLFVRGRGRYLRDRSREVFERAFARIERAGLAELVRDGARVVELRLRPTSAERAWMARVAARQALLIANDAGPEGDAGGAPVLTRQQRENARTAATAWVKRWRAKHPAETRTEAELEAHYLAHIYSPGSRGRKPGSNVTPPANVTQPVAPNVTQNITPNISVSLREGGERETLSFSHLSGDSGASDARATPDRNVTQPNVTQPPCVTFQPPDPPPANDPAPPPADPGAELVRLLREGARERLGSGSDTRLGAALLALQVAPDLTREDVVREMGAGAGVGAMPGQDRHDVFPVGLLLAGRDGDRQWLQSWSDASHGRVRKARRGARKAAAYEAAKQRPVAQQRLGPVADNTVHERATAPPVAAPTSTPLGPGPSKVELTREDRLKAIREARQSVGRMPR